jgi:hypothetical protein
MKLCYTPLCNVNFEAIELGTLNFKCLEFGFYNGDVEN